MYGVFILPAAHAHEGIRGGFWNLDLLLKEPFMFALSNSDEEKVMSLVVWGIIIFLGVLCFRRWRPAGTAFGVAQWATDKLLRAWGMLGNKGLILGRTLKGALIRIPRYCHVLLIGGSGSGKGIGIIMPNLLDYHRGSLVVFDPKGDLFATTARRRKGMKQRIIRLAPFNGGDDSWNMLDTIPADSPTLIDSARAMAEALVVREGTEPDPYWNSKAVQVITALLFLVLRRMTGEERSLNSVQDIASDSVMLAAAADKLQEMGDLAARLGSQIKMLFEKGTTLTKEGASVMSTVARHLSFLDSEMVAKSVAASTFDVHSLLKPGVTLYLTIPPNQLEAQKGLLRCWVSTLIRVLSSGSEANGEVLMLLHEASALGGLSAVEEALVRGRSAGVRLLLAYQSDSQVRVAFKDKPTLIHDNVSVQIQMGPPSSYEVAERISESLGDWTQVVDSYGENSGRSSNTGGGSGGSVSSGHSMNYSQQAHPLLRPSELLTMGEEFLIAFIRGLPAPILARRIKWYEDATFNPASAKRRGPKGGRWSLWFVWLVLLIAYLMVVLRGMGQR